MYLDEYPNCCTAMCITDFGGENVDDYGDNVYYTSTDEIISYCNQKIPMLKKDGYGFVVAITTDVQKYANEALEKLGFYHGEAKKGRNRDTGNLHMWFMPTHEFEKVEV